MKMQELKTAARSVKEHLKRQKMAYLFGSTTALLLWANGRQSKEFYAFLKDEGIDPLKFTCPEWYEEIIQNQK